MLDPKATSQVRTDDGGGSAFEWMSVPSVPAVKEVAIQPATTDVFLQPASNAQPATTTEKHSNTILTTRSVAVAIFIHSFIYSFISLLQQMSKRIRHYIWLKHITIMSLGK